MAEFDGFPPELFAFYAGLERDNSKSYWEANKTTWESSIKEPTKHLVDALQEEFGPLRTFRPNRDVRFSKDKSPYKTWLGVTSTPQAQGGIGYFLRVESDGMRLAGGAMALASDQLGRFRDAVTDDTTGSEFTDLIEKLAAESLPVGPGRIPTLKRTPSGFDPEGPRAEFLRWKGAVILRELPVAEWMHTAEAITEIRGTWRATTPLVEWLRRNVGATSRSTSRPR